MNSDKAELIEIAKKRGIDLIELLEKAKAIQAANGFPTILDADGAIGVIVYSPTVCSRRDGPRRGSAGERCLSFPEIL